jgi:hypothetical protein
MSILSINLNAFIMNVKLRSYLLLMCFLLQGSMMQQGVLDTTFNTADDGFKEMVLMT